MRGFEKIIGQTEPIGVLTTLLQKKNIPHALLFIGDKGIGKHTTANAFAMMCNCMGNGNNSPTDSKQKTTNGSKPTYSSESTLNPCGVCKQCVKIISGSHPDVIQIKPARQVIKIDQIRDMRHIVSMKPYMARQRVVVIDDAPAMNAAASNALLKLLEEPPDRTIFILISDNQNELLPTINSRCQPIRFHPIPLKAIETVLTAEKQADPEKAAVLAAMSHGSIARALDLLKKDWLERRNQLLGVIWPESPDSSVRRAPAKILALSARVAQEKETITAVLDGLNLWLRDLLIYRYCPDKVINSDLLATIDRHSAQYGVEALLKKLEAVHTARKKIEANCNLRLTLDNLFMQL